MAAPAGIVFWEGPSPIDGAPIVAIATGIGRPSKNVKTGPMVQTWILRADMLPTEAVASNCDRSICGDCPLRGDGTKNRICYVNIGQAPQNIYKAFKRGNYPKVTLAEAAQVLSGRQVRLGAYGDPGMLPVAVWARILDDATDYTGYTHQWRSIDPYFSDFCMASVETVEEARAAWLQNYRTFRVTATRSKGEKPCPAAPDKSPVQCISCPVKCHGGPGHSIVIHPHGSGAVHLAV